MEVGIKAHSSGIPDLDASKVTSGVFSIERIPAAALERMVTVADEAARFALTADTIQEGDTVFQSDIEKMFKVIDVENLDNAAGYQVYKGSVFWDTVQNKPVVITRLETGYTISGGETTQKTLTVDEDKALSDKADKVTGATENNFTAFNADGSLKDSGLSPSDFDAAGAASGAVAAHEVDHPAPTNRDARNDPAGAASGAVSSHEAAHPAPTSRDARNEAAGTAAGLISTHNSTYDHEKIEWSLSTYTYGAPVSGAITLNPSLAHTIFTPVDGGITSVFCPLSEEYPAVIWELETDGQYDITLDGWDQGDAGPIELPKAGKYTILLRRFGDGTTKQALLVTREA